MGDLNDQVRRLLLLQEIEAKRGALLGELERAKSGEYLHDAESRESSAASELDRRKHEISSKRKEARWNEKEADELRRECKALEERLYGGEVRNLKELEQMEKKARALREQIDRLEEKAITLMEEVECLEGELREFQKSYEERKAELDRAKAENERLIQETSAKLAQLEGESAEIEGRVDSGLLAEYRHLYDRKGGFPVAVVRDGACSGCRVGLSVIIANRVKRGEELCRCENCGRILCYVPDE